MQKSAKVFLIIGMVFQFYLIYPIILGVITIKKINNTKSFYEIIKWGVISSIFVSAIGGIFTILIANNENNKQENNETVKLNNPSNDFSDSLVKLKVLNDNELLTMQEYDEEKKKVLTAIKTGYMKFKTSTNKIKISKLSFILLLTTLPFYIISSIIAIRQSFFVNSSFTGFYSFVAIPTILVLLIVIFIFQVFMIKIKPKYNRAFELLSGILHILVFLLSFFIIVDFADISQILNDIFILLFSIFILIAMTLSIIDITLCFIKMHNSSIKLNSNRIVKLNNKYFYICDKLMNLKNQFNNNILTKEEFEELRENYILQFPLL